jgi:formylglycine-generating enzyme required for sulfatase activity
MGRKSSLAGAAACVLAVGGCGPETRDLPPYPEVVVEVDTNLRTPQTISRVRFDIFDAQKRWIASRDVATPQPSDFPLSFSVYSDSPPERASAWVRVRGYKEGRLRDYQGERFAERPTFQEPSVSESLARACQDAPLLSLGQTSSLRLRSEAFADAELGCIASDGRTTKHVQSGLAVFRLPILDPGSYRIAVLGAQPGVEWAAVADTVLSLRRACEVPTSELACNDDERAELGNLSGLRRDLEPGDYFVLVGNVAPGAMDVTMILEQDESFMTVPQVGGGEIQVSSPRLVVDGLDATPAREPDPNLAVDRLVRLELEPGQQSTARLLLDGECLGTMADLAGGRSCVDTEGELVAVEAERLRAGRLPRGPSAVGSWASYGTDPCVDPPPPPTPGLYDDRQCVQGGSFLLGDPTLIARGADDGSPERLATIPTFSMDRYEYSVARYRAALARGFVPPDGGPYNNYEPFALEATNLMRACTWSVERDGTTRFPERDALPLSCVSWLTAQALCAFDGGRLPSVAQREYAASAAGRELESSYPWGEDRPECGQAVFGRWIESNHGSSSCLDSAPSMGPSAVDAQPWADLDRTPSGIVALGGNVAEWTRDSHRSYADDCWQSQLHLEPECIEAQAPLRTIAGGSWRSPAAGTRSASRVGGAVAGQDPWVGLRCVYGGWQQ